MSDRFVDIAREIVTVNAPLLSPSTQADLIAAILAALQRVHDDATEQEREACAKVADNVHGFEELDDCVSARDAYRACEFVKDRIRARKGGGRE